MLIQGRATRVTIYLGESDHYEGQPLYLALLQRLKQAGASGATVMRGVAGFGAHSRVHTASIMTLSTDLPLVVTWVDTPARVERLLPTLQIMVNAGLITQEEVDVVQYAPGRHQAPLEAPVQDAMRREIVTVRADTPVAELVPRLLQHGLRSVPVIDDDGRLIGIITDGDLLRRAKLTARLGLHDKFSTTEVQAQIDALSRAGLHADDVMTQPVIVVQATDTLRTAARQMADHQLKRLPVVDDRQRLVGWISRVDLFRMLEYHFAARPQTPEPHRLGGTVTELMHQDVATVAPQANLEAILQALEQHHRRRVIVVDVQQRVLGIITDGDLLHRSKTREPRTLLERLRGLLGSGTPSAGPMPAGNERAVDLMTTPVFSIHAEMTLDHALQTMLRHNIKWLPVIDPNGRLLGLLGRGSVLRGVLAAPETDAETDTQTNAETNADQDRDQDIAADAAQTD
jgi:CBS domain-containing protein/PII-like signaling protein